MNTFRDKHFKNGLNPKNSFYYCLRSCELKSTYENSIEECVENCELKLLPKNLDC